LTQASVHRRALRVGLRAAAGIALLALVIWVVGPDRVGAQLRTASLPWFGAALLCAIAANVVSAWRWGVIAHALGLRARLPLLLSAYAQGITVNTVLPGATLGGDALRSVQLARAGNDALLSAASVFLDRASGLWVLCAVSLLAATVLAATTPAALLGAHSAGVLSLPMIVALAAALVLLLALPFVVGSPAPRPGAAPRLARWHHLRSLLHAKRAVLARSLLPSAAVQVLSAGTLWLCLRAAGGAGTEVGFVAVLTVAAPVFLAAAVPVSVGGFGPREAAAALAFPWVGATPEAGVMAALMYGLTAAAQGVMAAPLLALSSSSRAALPPTAGH